MFHPNNQAVRPTDPYQSREELSPAGQQAVLDVQASLARSDLGGQPPVGAGRNTLHVDVPTNFASDANWMNRSPGPTMTPHWLHQSYHPMQYKSDSATTPSMPQGGFNPNGWHELSVAEIKQLERDRQWIQGHNFANAAANRDGNLIWYWKTWKANGKTYGERIIGRESFLYVGASGPPKGVWHALSGVDSSGLGATPTLHSDGRWYCGVGRVAMRWSGFGDVASDFDAFNSSIDAGDIYLGNGEYQNAVVAYQAAGNSAVIDQPGHVAYDIDTYTNGASKPLTQQAYAMNGNLASVNSGADASASDATAAQGWIRQMQNLYAQGAAMQPTGAAVVAPSSDLVSAAQSLAAAINANGCNGSQDVTTTFQKAYDAEGQVILKQDGKYGPLTAAALQRVLDTFSGGTAPAACHYSSSSSGGGSSSTSAASGTPSSSPTWLPWVIGGAVVAAGGVVAVVAHNKKKRR